MKRERHEVVVDLINKYDIETQEELAAYLRKEGYEVTGNGIERHSGAAPVKNRGGRRQTEVYHSSK